MKKNIITGLLFLFFITSYSQCKIVYDFETGKFKTYNLKTVKPECKCEKKLKKGSTNKLYIKNYNPFIYTLSSQIKTLDNAAKLPKFIVKTVNFGQAKLLNFSFGELSLPNIDAEPLENIYTIDTTRLGKIKKFFTKYYDALDIFSQIQKPSLNCHNIESLMDTFNEKDLFGYYKLAFEAYNRGGANRAINKYEPYFKPEFLDKIIDLNLLLISLENYLMSLGNCEILVKSFKAKGEATIIALEFTPRNEASSFNAPSKIVPPPLTLKTKQAFNIYFSSGIMLTQNLKKDFFVQKIDSVQFKIMEEDRGKYLPGITTLAHIKPMESDLSLLIGGGINIEGTVHLLTGISVPINKINLNFGYGWALVEKLSDGISESLIFSEKPKIKTKKILDGNIWFGLSYNF